MDKIANYTPNTGDDLFLVAVIVGALCALCCIGAALAWLSDHVIMPWLARRSQRGKLGRHRGVGRPIIIQPQNRAARRRQKKVKQYWGM